MEKQVIKLGYAPTKRDGFNHPEANEYRKRILKAIVPFGAEIVDIKGINDEDMLKYASDVPKAVDMFQRANVDGVFFPHCNFGSESLVARIAGNLNLPVLLWGPRDGMPKPDDFRPRDTQCGLFATGKVLRRMNIPFTYLPNCCLEAPEFQRGFKSFIGVCSVVKDFRKTRILQISVRPEAFWTVMYNEGELLEKFGIQVFPLTLQDVKNHIEKLAATDSDSVKIALADFRSRLNCDCANDQQLTAMARLRVAIKELCAIHECNSAAIHCWEAIQKALGAATCTINGVLTEEGIPVACEVDIHGAVTSIILQAAAMRTKSTFFADLTIRHPTNENAELLWHCGNFPPSLAVDPTQRNLNMICQNLGPIAAQSNWEIKHGDITVCRLDGDHGQYSLFIGEGKGVDGPKTRGTYVWFEVDNWPKWEKHLVEGPYIHHCSGIHEKVAHVLYESCKYIGIEADVLSPSKDELEARWLGQT